jgi:hypothetical protein
MPIAAIALVVLGFFAWWPLGLLILAFMIGSRRFLFHAGAPNSSSYCWSHDGNGRWEHRTSRWQSKIERMQQKMDRVRGKMDGLRSAGDWWGAAPSSGNRAFDDYRSETLRRLEDEQREFRDFLQRLRFAKDKTQFDQFMAERRDRAPDPGPQPQS